jgi:hypothetical protein
MVPKRGTMRTDGGTPGSWPRKAPPKKNQKNPKKQQQKRGGVGRLLVGCFLLFVLIFL